MLKVLRMIQICSTEIYRKYQIIGVDAASGLLQAM